MRYTITLAFSLILQYNWQTRVQVQSGRSTGLRRQQFLATRELETNEQSLREEEPQKAGKFEKTSREQQLG